MKQVLIVEESSAAFKKTVTNALSSGAIIVPGTLSVQKCMVPLAKLGTDISPTLVRTETTYVVVIQWP